jgi:hypothetical protein
MMTTAIATIPEPPLDPWSILTGSDRAVCEKCEASLVQLKAATTQGFWHWLDVGAAKDRLEQLAMNLSGANQPAGKAYNIAFDGLIAHLPHLKKLHEKDKGTVSRALWMHRNRAELEAWHGELEEHEQLRCNHPRVVKERFEHRHDPESDDANGQKDKKPKEKKPTAADLQIAALKREIDELKVLVMELEAELNRVSGELKDAIARRDDLVIECAEIGRKNENQRQIIAELSGEPSQPRRKPRTLPLDDPNRPRNKGKTGRPPKLPWYTTAVGESFPVTGYKLSDVKRRAATFERYGLYFPSRAAKVR